MPTFRPATPADASDLAVLLDSAARRLVSWRWSTLAAPGESWFEVGRQRILTLTDNQSHYANWLIAEAAGRTVGALNAHAVPQAEGAPELDGVDPVFVPLVELAALTGGTFYIMGLAIFAEARGQGHGAALLDRAAELARVAGLTRLTLITETFNTGARRLYLRHGFRDIAERPFVPFPGSDEAGHWTLMARDLA